MLDTRDLLPLTATWAPAELAEVAAMVERAYADETALYPLGGETNLGLGAVPERPGVGLKIANLNRVVDYPSRDMTITVEAGIPLAALAATLAAEGQRLPIDVARAEQATLGGAIATNASGPRRFGYGTLRDYVIGISGVDGRGVAFKGGGRVVKNVAGYDFCKLLTGSLGTLAVITQVTLKVRPLVEASTLVACNVNDATQLESLLAGLIQSQTTPVAIEVLAGPDWDADPAFAGLNAHCFARLVVGFEGTQVEVDWQIPQIQREWQAAGVSTTTVIAESQATHLWQRLTGWSGSGLMSAGEAALLVKLSVVSSHLVELVATIRNRSPQSSILAHAGNGICIVRFAGDAIGANASLWREFIWPAVARGAGQAIVLAAADRAHLTQEIVWGPPDGARHLMTSIKQQFDPKGLLNPGRFVY